ncbi:MAG: hypothetical protein EOO08_07440 [Chitinophagaceae bacterium]|nr:MAG: hypothetical protein EOO08_07440 [Chitinophagaceae bacterium]
MARFLKHIGLFLVYALPLYLGFLFLFGSLLPNRYLGNFFPRPDSRSFLRERIQEIPQHGGADLLVVGSSVGQRSIDPRVFSRSRFSVLILASGGQNPMQTEVLLKRYVHALRPKCVAIAINPDLYTTDRAEPSIDLILSDRIDGDNWRDAWRRPDLRLVNTLLFWWMRQELGVRPPALRTSNELDVYVPGGYLERRPPVRNTDLAAACIPGPSVPLNPIHLAALDNCIAFLKQRGIPFVLLQPPLSAARYRCRRFPAQIDSTFSARGRYYNYNLQLPLSDTFDFIDNAHLAPSGAIKFSEAFLRQMQMDGYLK